MDEGGGSCRYYIGVEDDGCHSLLDYPSVAESARVLECIARSLNAIVVERVMIQHEVVERDGELVVAPDGSIRAFEAPIFGDASGKEVVVKEDPMLCKEPGVMTRGELSIHRVETHLLDPSPKSVAELANASQGNGTLEANHDESFSIGETLSARNIRVAVVGNVDAGKSTLIGTLITAALDDGRGKSRTAIMKHRHEIESGRTSTATTHLLGFRSTGEPVTGRDAVRAKRKSEDEVARESYKTVTLMDLAGHEKYLKTT
jgi:GTPase